MRAHGVVVGVALLVSAATAWAQEHAGERPMVQTERGAVIPDGGGVLVVCCDGDQDGARRDPAIQRAWRCAAGGRSVKPEVRSLAPGLAVYRGARRGDVTLLDEDGDELSYFRFGGRVPFVARAPRLAGVYDGDVDVESKAPDGAVAMIVYVVGARGSRAIAWWPVEDSPLPRATHGPGARRPRVGERIEVRWVDGFGRLTRASRAVVVRRAAVPPAQPEPPTCCQGDRCGLECPMITTVDVCVTEECFEDVPPPPPPTPRPRRFGPGS